MSGSMLVVLGISVAPLVFLVGASFEAFRTKKEKGMSVWKALP